MRLGVVGFAVVLAMLATASKGEAIQPTSPADGATLFQDRAMEFSAKDVCPFFEMQGGPGPARILLSTSPETASQPHPDPGSPFTLPAASLAHPFYTTFEEQFGQAIHRFVYHAESIPFADLPPKGTVIYWQPYCAGDTVASPIRTLIADPGSRKKPASLDEVGLSVNGGDIFTNDPNVVVKVVAPEFTDKIRLANDGGFGSSKVFALDGGARGDFQWKLVSSGPERLPKTVYMRFAGSTQTLTDDIILDETAPELNSASLSGSQGQASRLVPRKAAKGVLTVKATDKTSGVEKMQFGRSKKRAGNWVRFKAKTKVKASKKLIVRVKDGAGNVSKWIRAK